jgi:hypothetical protein
MSSTALKVPARVAERSSMTRLPLAALCAALFALALPAAAGATSNVAPEPALALGAGHTCVLADSGRVYCWGANEKGQLGTGDTLGRSEPTEVPGLTKIAGLVAYSDGACAFTRDGAVHCWGANDKSQLGSGATDSDAHPTPTVVESATGVYKLVAGDAHVCSVSWNDGVKCWGDNSAGQLAATGASDLKTITASAQATCLRTHNSMYPLCHGSIAAIPQVKDTWEIVAGGQHACLLSWSKEGVTCWGNGMPDLSAVGSVEHLGSSQNYSCAVAKTRLPEGGVSAATYESKTASLQCWGAGNAPANLPLNNVGVLSASSSALRQCAIVRGGEISCWDEGTTTPTPVAGLDVVTRPQYPANKWVEITSKLRGKGRHLKMTSKLHLQPSPLVYPSQACKGTVAADLFWWKKVRRSKKAGTSKSGADEYRRVGVRTKARLYRAGDWCKANFKHKVSKKRFAGKRRQLMVRAIGFGNSQVSKFESGESALKDYKPKK